MSKKYHLILVLGLMLVVLLTACERSAAQAPLPTPTATGDLLFLAAGDPMRMLQTYATQTAMAGTAHPTLSGTALTPGNLTPVAAGTTTTAVATNLTPGTPATIVTVTPTRIIVATSTPGRPATYTLQKGEYPYCIARRFNVNPDELLQLNSLANGLVYQPGLVLKIPQTNNPFPGTRALHAHPATYTVSSAEDTIYKVACYYGDIDPLVIAAVNSLTSPYTLRVGQVLNIP